MRRRVALTLAGSHSMKSCIIVGVSVMAGGLLAAVSLVAGSGGAWAEPAHLTVVELFTSQGCSSCPPANANLATISERPGVLALSFGVIYWDRLGWKDVFARQDYTERQVAYEAPLGESGPFTPQMVVDGRRSLVGNRLDEVDDVLVAASVDAGRKGPAVALRQGSVTLGSGPAPGESADVWLVRYDPRSVAVAVRNGENSGRTLPHKNVVHDLTRIGHWAGRPMILPVAPAAAGLRTAILVQVPSGGPILAAITD